MNAVQFGNRGTIVRFALMAGVDPFSAMRFVDADVTAGELHALVLLVNDRAPQLRERKERERCASLS